MLLPVTLTIAAACAVLNLWLASRLVGGRLKGIAVGDGGSPVMLARMRAHANFTEYAPFVLILIAGIELAGGSPTWLWAAGVAFVLGRVLHPFGMERPVPNALRAGGILSTWLVLAALAGWAVVLVYGATHGGGVTAFAVDPPRG